MFIRVEKSSNVFGYEYFPHAQTLLIRFGSGAYLYEPIDPATYNKLVTTHRHGDSVGSFVARTLRPGFKGKRVDDEQQVEALRAVAKQQPVTEERVKHLDICHHGSHQVDYLGEWTTCPDYFVTPEQVAQLQSAPRAPEKRA